MIDAATRLLILARDKIIAPGAWTQGAFARTSLGGPDVMPTDPWATCWCSLGACRSVGYNTGVVIQAEARLSAWTRKNFGMLVETYNDRSKRTQAEVVDMFDEVIAAGPLPHQV